MEVCRCVEFTDVEFVGDATWSSLLRWRKLRRVCALENPRRAGGTVEREKDGLSCSSAKEMSAGRAVARWRGRHCGEGSAMESAVTEAAWRSVIVESCHGATVK
jgi:hypothetical protein